MNPLRIVERRQVRATRRSFLSLAIVAPVAALAAARSAHAQDSGCYVPDALPMSQKSRRRSLGYVDMSGDQKRRCDLCSFFSASQPGCGRCTLLNGSVNAGGLCNSFAIKAG